MRHSLQTIINLQISRNGNNYPTRLLILLQNFYENNHLCFDTNYVLITLFLEMILTTPKNTCFILILNFNGTRSIVMTMWNKSKVSLKVNTHSHVYTHIHKSSFSLYRSIVFNKRIDIFRSTESVPDYDSCKENFNIKQT